MNTVIAGMHARKQRKHTLRSLIEASALLCAAFAAASSDRRLAACSDEDDAVAADSATALEYLSEAEESSDSNTDTRCLAASNSEFVDWNHQAVK
jgi:hypothetical protein